MSYTIVRLGYVGMSYTIVRLGYVGMSYTLVKLGYVGMGYNNKTSTTFYIFILITALQYCKMY